MARFSTLLQIISITEIKVRKITRQVLGIDDGATQGLTVEETIGLVKQMQSIRPDTPEAEGDGEQSEKDPGTPVGTYGRVRSGAALWDKLNARRKKGEIKDQTLSKAFLRNYDRLAELIRQQDAQEEQVTEKEDDFRNLDRKSRKTIVKVIKDDNYKDHILQRSNESKNRLRGVVNKVMGKGSRLFDVVQKAQEQESRMDFGEEQDEVNEERQSRSPAGSHGSVSRSPAGSHRSASRRRKPSPKSTPVMLRLARLLKQKQAEGAGAPGTTAAEVARTPPGSAASSVRGQRTRVEHAPDFEQDDRGFLRPPSASFHFAEMAGGDSPDTYQTVPHIEPGSPRLSRASLRVTPGSDLDSPRTSLNMTPDSPSMPRLSSAMDEGSLDASGDLPQSTGVFEM